MQFNLKALLLFIGVIAFLAFALTSSHAAWFPFVEAAATVGILLGVLGLLRDRSARTR